MSIETDNLYYEGMCKWDSCFDCPHMCDCADSGFKEENDEA